MRTGRDGSFRATRLAPGEGQRLDVRHDEYEERALGGISLVAGGDALGPRSSSCGAASPSAGS